MPVDQGTLDAVSTANYKVVAETPTISSTSHQTRLQLLAEASLAQQLNRMNGLDPTEAASIAKVTQAGDSKELARMGAAIAAMQQMLHKAEATRAPV